MKFIVWTHAYYFSWIFLSNDGGSMIFGFQGPPTPTGQDLHKALNFDQQKCLKEFRITFWSYLANANSVHFISLRNGPKFQIRTVWKWTKVTIWHVIKISRVKLQVGPLFNYSNLQLWSIWSIQFIWSMWSICSIRSIFGSFCPFKTSRTFQFHMIAKIIKAWLMMT